MAVVHPLVATGDTTPPIELPRDANGTLTLQLNQPGAAFAATTVELQVAVGEAQWKAIKMKNPNSDLMVDNLTAAGDIGWAECVGYAQARAHALAIGGGPVGITLEFRPY